MRLNRRASLLTTIAVGAAVLSCDSEGGRTSTAAIAAVPAQLQIATQPGGALSGTTLSTQPVVQVVDSRLQPVVSSGTQVTAEIETGTGTLGGTTTVDGSDGTASFTDLSVSGSGPHVLRFVSRGLPAVTSSTITISPPTVAASQIGVASVPSSAVSGVDFFTPPVVQLRDTSGNLVTSATAPVTASLASGSGALVGTTTVNAIGGVATFSSLHIEGAGPHTLAFSSTGLTGATSGTINVTQAAASLGVATQPAGATTGSPMTTQPVVRINDNAGLLVTTSTLPVTASISSGGGTLLGTRTVNAVAGMASFGDLRIDGSGTHVLAFTAATQNPQVTSNPFAVAVGPATRVVLVTQPAGAVSGSPFVTQPVLHVRDAGNNLVTTSTAAVTAAVLSGTGTLLGTATVNAVNGVVSFAGLGITGSGAHSLVFTSPGLTSANSATFNVATVPPPAAQLAITTQPGGAMSGVPFTTQPVVQIRDANNVLVPSSTATVTVAIAGGSGTLSGTTSVAAVNGVATFTNLAITGSGTHTLVFTSTGLTSATSSVFIVAGTATQLAITTQPAGAASGSPFTTQPVIQVRDASGNLVSGSTAAVTAAVASGNGVLSGTTTVNAVNGVVTFTNLTLTGSGSHTLVFTSAGLTSVTSAAFMVIGGPATQLAIAMQPASAVSGQTLSPQPVIQIRDAANAVVSSSAAPVTAAISTGTGTLSGTTTVNAVNGIASFTNLAITGSGAHRLTFTSGTLTPATTNSFDVTSQVVAGTREPANFTPITERDFAAKVESNWLDRGDANFSIQSDATATRADKVVGQALFPTGFVAGSGPINTYFNIPGTYRQLYFSMWIKFSSNFFGQSAGVNKIVFIWIDGNANVFLNAQGQGTGPLTPSINLQNNVGGAVRLGPNLAPGVTFTRDQWHLWEVVLVANTVGQLDGSVRWWLDGVEIGNYTNIGPAKNSSNRWEIVSWNPTWGGAGGTVPADMWQRIDHIKVSGLP